MKSTGVVRKVDELGRIVLPISIRQIMDINEKDSLEIFTDENKIILVEQWDSREAQKVHLDQPHMAGIYAAEKEHVANVNLEFYDF